MFNDKIKQLENQIIEIQNKHNKELAELQTSTEKTMNSFKKAKWHDLDRLMNLQIRAIGDIAKLMADMNMLLDEIRIIDVDRTIKDAVKNYLENHKIVIE